MEQANSIALPPSIAAEGTTGTTSTALEPAAPAPSFHASPQFTLGAAVRFPGQVWTLEAIWQVLGTQGAGISVAVLDTGSAQHSAYQAQLASLSSVVPMHHGEHEPSGHGTHVTSILTAVAP